MTSILLAAALVLLTLAALVGLPWYRQYRAKANDRAVRCMMTSLARYQIDALQLARGGRVPGEPLPLPPFLAEADTTPGRSGGRTPVPYSGYYFRAGDPMTRWNDSAFEAAPGPCAVYAYPAVYGKTGILTYFVNGTGLFSKDTNGVCPDKVLLPKELRDGWWSIID